MKISLEKKIFIGYILNVLAVIASALIIINRLSKNKSTQSGLINYGVEFAIFGVLITLLTIVYFIIRSQIRAKDIFQNSLLENKQLLQSIIDNSSSLITVKKVSGEYIFVNKQFSSLFQAVNETIPGKIDADFLPKALLDPFRNADFEVQRGLKEIKTEEILELPEGPRPYLAIRFPLYDSFGKIYAIGSIFTDIKQQKEASRYVRSLIEASLDSLIIINKEGSITDLNLAFENITGISRDKIIGTNFSNYFTEPQKADEAYRIVFENGILSDYLLTIKDKSGKCTPVNCNASVYKDDKGNVSGVFAAARDVSEQRKLESSLKSANTFFDLSMEMMVIVKENTFIKVNPATIRTIGYTEEELLDRPFLEFVHPDDIKITLKELEILKLGTVTSNFENRCICKDGSIKWLSWSIIREASTGLLYALALDITDKKEAQKALLVGDKFFSMSYDFFGVINLGYFTKVNASFSRILGYTQEEASLKTLTSLAHPEDLKIYEEAIRKLQEGKSDINFRARSICKDGTYKWLEWSATIDVQTAIVYAAARDVSELVNTENILKLADTFFNMSSEAFVVGKDDRLLRINPAFTKTFGYAENELENLTIFSMAKDQQVAKEAIEKLKKGESLNEFVIDEKHKNGSDIWINWNIIMDKQTGSMYGVARDITQIKLAQKNLDEYNKIVEKNEKQIQSIIEGAPDSVVVVNAETVIKTWNKRAELVFGWKKEEVIGKQLFEFITHPRNVETYKKNMKLFLDTSSKLIVGKTNDISVLNKEGEEFPVSISVAPLESNGDQLFILFFRNITEVKKIVDDLRENEETLQFIIDNIGEGVLVVNHEHHVLLANDVANELYGVEQGTRMPVHLSDRFELYYPDGKTIFPSQYLPTTIALNGQISDDLYLVLWDPIEKIKKRVLVSGKPIFNDNKQIVAAVITIKDITKYVQLEDELRDSLSNYRKLIGFKKEEADKSEALKLKEEEEPKPNE